MGRPRPVRVRVTVQPGAAQRVSGRDETLVDAAGGGVGSRTRLGLVALGSVMAGLG